MNRLGPEFGYFEPSDEPEGGVQRGMSEGSMQLSRDLLVAFQASCEAGNPCFRDILTGLVDATVWCAKATEALPGVPASFREVLMRNIALNFEYADLSPEGKDAMGDLLVGIAEQLGAEGMS